MKVCDIAVVGGGASGLVAAISAKRANPKKEVFILERNDRVGKKILSTGNGRCNISNENIDSRHYYGGNKEFINSLLNIFPRNDVLNFFESMGVLCYGEEGRLYPLSNQASSVVDALRFECDKLGVKTICSFFVKTIDKNEKGYIINNEIVSKKVIITSGGKASPMNGTDGNGYALLKRFGHTITTLAPALVQLKSESSYTKALKGIRAKAMVNAFNGDKKVRSEEGEILFTEYGLSGIPILQLSRIASCGRMKVTLDFLPQLSFDETIEVIKNRIKILGDRSLENFFVGMINKRLAQMLFKSADIIPLSRRADSMTSEEIICLTKNIKGWEFNITGTNSWQNAQVTAGGAKVSEFDANTMESKLSKGLYAAGEILDIDGDCGGYNLHFAWVTGYIAGKEAAK